jgi:hypothetical protein
MAQVNTGELRLKATDSTEVGIEATAIGPHKASRFAYYQLLATPAESIFCRLSL